MMNKKVLTNLTRQKVILLLSALLWIETIIAYFVDFNLGIEGPLQILIALFNPFGFILLILSIANYIVRKKTFTTAIIILFALETIILIANVIYYREFSDFISIDTILSAQKFNGAMGKSITTLLMPQDWIYLINLALIILLPFMIHRYLQTQPTRMVNKVALTSVGMLLVVVNLTISEMNRPQLLGRTFDQTYIVKYLGLNFYTLYNSANKVNEDTEKNNVTTIDIDSPLKVVDSIYAKPNKKYFGIARKKNVIIIHLESFQQVLINMKVNNQEVTPFLNSLYSDKNTISFPNFFHEVGQGKTSDAEMMLESGLFGMPTGSFFNKLGPSNTFQSAPAILQQKEGYTSAVFHGNVGSFYSRSKVYKNMGYNYFFDQGYFDQTEDSNIGFGLKDKLMFQESVKYLEKLQQPFYVKYITLTNHYPFDLSEEDNDGFVKPTTQNNVVNNYFETAHYLDASLQEFFKYLKQSGLYDKSMIVLYGDHYGISDDKNTALAPLLNKNPNTWNKFDNAQLQRVPFMINMKGLSGHVDNEYGGEIDVLPTILHLLGVNTRGYIQLGTDLLSKQHDGNVVFRDNNLINKNYTIFKNSKGSFDVYDNKDGKLIDLNSYPGLEENIAQIYEKKQELLNTSDTVNNKNLLRFYTPTGLKPTNPQEYDYDHEENKLNEINNSLGNASTSLYSQNNDKTTTSLYETNAPEAGN
ncbi:LTA synthase family protein [Companilactobacillus heilongjiangensis]|uniref:Alkaline phosphatase n=1 Tax=Companilactobacillus heilongjiangensis TaxID=1074467 RepID=A0A0K2LC65_9LACO|nr:LTA synthase family protein [Companilactobacillus heilongjiangensis]ALB28894.1 alkaline phosphatase [Companilactobacillus heilongjiangensis]